MTGYDVFDRAQNRLFALFFQPVLKLIVRVKVVLDRLFAATCDEDNFSDARRDSFLLIASGRVPNTVNIFFTIYLYPIKKNTLFKLSRQT